VDVRHADERVAAVVAGEHPVALRLDDVIELLEHALLDLGDDRREVDAGDDGLGGPREQAQVLDVRADGARDPRVLDLDRHLGSCIQPRPVDLADRGGAHRV
jgi:hypothetical protein